MSVSKSSSFPNLCFLNFSAFSVREGKQWMYCCQGFLIKSPDMDQHFVCFLRYLDHPWSKLGRNHVLGKNGGSGFRCFCQDQYFSSMFIYKLFNLPWHIHGGKGRLSLSADVNWQLRGGEEKTEVLEKPPEEEREACPLCTFCVLGSSHIDWPASALHSYKNRHMKQFRRMRGPEMKMKLRYPFLPITLTKASKK